jgi:hypothetical protein
MLASAQRKPGKKVTVTKRWSRANPIVIEIVDVVLAVVARGSF